jgi:hypothetical protein
VAGELMPFEKSDSLTEGLFFGSPSFWHRPQNAQPFWKTPMLKQSLVLPILLACGFASASGPTQVMVQDYERSSARPTVWVVNIPNENASVKLSADGPQAGKQYLKLHYRFVADGQFQYLGVPNAVHIQSRIHKLRYWLKGDDSRCSYGVQLTDAGGETHQFGQNTGQGGTIDFTGWKEVVIDIDSHHETWGGDKNGKIDYPISAIIFTIGQPTHEKKPLPAEGDLGFDSLSVDSDGTIAETLGHGISVVSPEYCSDIHGAARVVVAAPGFKQLTAKCWKQDNGPGADSTVATINLDASGAGSFVLPAEQYPHGPITVRISGDSGSVKDNCYLQLYNTAGVSWNEGIPKHAPPAANGMSLVFADDFSGSLSISSKDPKARYYDHKPPNGWQDFSAHRFADRNSPSNPFAHVDTYLRIRASDDLKSSGLISSLKTNGAGITAKAPCYFECRLLGPNSIGTWPAFWLLTDPGADMLKANAPGDELDIIEAYGGEGPREPNAFDTYMITPHCWNQGAAGKARETKAFEGMHNPIHMRKFGIPATWFETFHIYGCKVTETDTIYYCDNVEVGRHPTFPLSKQRPLYFLIDLATGGGWPVDLSRYHGLADMYVDYVRVYSGAAADRQSPGK